MRVRTKTTLGWFGRQQPSRSKRRVLLQVGYEEFRPDEENADAQMRLTRQRICSKRPPVEGGFFAGASQFVATRGRHGAGCALRAICLRNDGVLAAVSVRSSCDCWGQNLLALLTRKRYAAFRPQRQRDFPRPAFGLRISE